MRESILTSQPQHQWPYTESFPFVNVPDTVFVCLWAIPPPPALPPCSVIRKADPQWLHRRSTCPLPSVWVWPMEAGGRSLEAERRVRIRATMFWLLIQSVTSWLPSTESHGSGGSYSLWMWVTAPSSAPFCLGMVQALCCWQSTILNQLFLVSPVPACTFTEDISIKLSSVSSLSVLFVFFWELVWYQLLASIQFSSVAQSCLTLCNAMDCSMPGLPVHHQLPEFIQTHAH